MCVQWKKKHTVFFVMSLFNAIRARQSRELNERRDTALADPSTMLSLSGFVQDCFETHAAGKPVSAVGSKFDRWAYFSAMVQCKFDRGQLPRVEVTPHDQSDLEDIKTVLDHGLVRPKDVALDISTLSGSVVVKPGPWPRNCVCTV